MGLGPLDRSFGGRACSPSAEQVFTVLSNRRRRFALHYLLQDGESVELNSLARQIAAWENGLSADDVTYDQRRNVRTALKRTHLPKLEAADLVEHENSSVTATEYCGALDVYVGIVRPGPRIPWSQFYAAAGLAFLALTSLVALQVPGFAIVPPLAWAGLISAGFATAGLAHVYYDHCHKLGSTGPPPETPPEGPAPADD